MHKLIHSRDVEEAFCTIKCVLRENNLGSLASHDFGMLKQHGQGDRKKELTFVRCDNRDARRVCVISLSHSNA